MNRAFYRIARSRVRPEVTASGLDVVLLYASRDYFYVLAPKERWDVAEAFGADYLGATWEEFWDAAPQVRGYIFRARIKRTGERLTVPLGEVEPGDIVISSPYPPTRYSGDGPPRRLAV